MKKGNLYLIPTLLGDSPVDDVLPGSLKNILGNIKHFVVEDLRTARRFLKKLDKSTDIDSLSFYLLNEHSVSEDLPDMLKPLKGELLKAGRRRILVIILSETTRYHTANRLELWAAWVPFFARFIRTRFMISIYADYSPELKWLVLNFMRPLILRFGAIIFTAAIVGYG